MAQQSSGLDSPLTHYLPRILPVEAPLHTITYLITVALYTVVALTIVVFTVVARIIVVYMVAVGASVGVMGMCTIMEAKVSILRLCMVV